MEKVEGYVAYLQHWEESERGWGVRPDGLSMHPDEESAKLYRDRIIAINETPSGLGVPNEYDRPDGNLKKVVVTERLRDIILSKEGTFRVQRSEVQHVRTDILYGF